MSLRLLLVPFAALIGLLSAGPRPFNIDRSHSEINFVVEAKFLDVHGFFDSFTVVTQLDPDSITNSSVRITIDPRYVNTRITRRDNHLRTCDFFCVDSFATISFQSRQVTRVGPVNYRIDGDLTMRGTTRPMSIPARMLYNDPGAARFTGQFDINRRDFNINGDGGGGIINDSVHVEFSFALRDPAMRRGGPGAPPPGAQPPATPPRSQ